MVSFQVIGQPTPRADALEKVTGRALYAADQAIPEVLWGKVLLSPYSHARIVRIDATAARRLPGVHALITGADVQGHLYGRRIRDMPILAQDRVRYSGERVAAVAAESKDIAQAALDLIEVEYEDLPAVFEIEDAMESGAPILHPDFNEYPGVRPAEGGSNAYSATANDRGDLDRGFAEADLIVETTFRTPRVHQVYLEPHTAVVAIQSERVHVWATSKAPLGIRDTFAAAVGLPKEQVVLHHSHIGGDFGGKGTPLDLPACYFLAQASGRPVRIVADYVEEFLAGNPRHSTVVKLRTGVKQDGTLTAHHVQFYVNCGAYAAYKPGGVIGGAPHAAGPYRVANSRVESTQVYTNVVPGGHMRGPGVPQATFALESQIDEIARRLGRDPVDFRLQNLIVDGDESAAGEKLKSVRVKETLIAAVEAAGYRDPKPSHVGRGVAVGEHAAGGGQANAAVTINPDGSVVLGTAVFDQGSGTYTILRQVIAEELQVSPERVRLNIWTTDAVDADSGIGSSRGTRINTQAAHEASLDAKAALLDLASEQLGWPRGSLALRGEEVIRTDEDATLSWTEILRKSGKTVTGRSFVDDRASTHQTGFVGQVAEVRIDPETGQIELLRVTSAHDVGRVLNPMGHQGQVNGGFVQGLGFALMEELRIEEGRVTNVSFADYKIPTIRDIPDLRTVLVESEEGSGPYQVKGIGENSIVGVAPAIANAIADAVGCRITELPITSEKVYEALKAFQAKV
ncbi:MAG: molybdopterin-dependent oxidoreductase [Dehalococcoidia bacterium]|nr:molybdopterin-dependent oxidoreductase [Dehalococcoidia bacterium]